MWKFVRAQVLLPQTPRSMRKLASGYHQRIQHTTAKVGSATVLRSLLRTVKIRKENNMDTSFTDEDLHAELLSVGVAPVKGTKGGATSAEETPDEGSPEGKAKGKQKKKSASDLEVCVNFNCALPTHVFRLCSTWHW